MPRDFGVCPATQFVERPATFSKTAKNLGKNRPKMAADPQHYVQYVVPYGCKSSKNYLRQILYARTNFS